MRAALLALALLLPITARAEGAFIADLDSGCQVWNPTPQLGETARWQGACRDGKAEGRGVLTWLLGTRVLERDEGEWHLGRQVGLGRQAWAAGRYEGFLADSAPDGEGSMVMATGERFTGSFRAGQPHGRGRLERGGEVFEGEWRAGCFRAAGRAASFGATVACGE
jgi:hypothetical protein